MSRIRAEHGSTVRILLTATASLLCATLAPTGASASEWNAETHALAIGDFDGDGKSDLLYIAKDQGQASGIALSNGTAPNIDHQSWPATFLGIPWHSGNYHPVVGDFNGDGRSDLLLQATAAGGSSHLLYTNAEGRFDNNSLHQSIPAYCKSLYWPATDHRIISGNFVNNGSHATTGQARRDLLLQATKRGGTNALVTMSAVSTPHGERAEVACGTGASQTWGDGTAGFQWSLAQAVVHAGNFNNDGYDDVFVHAKPDFVLIDYDIPFPVPTYRPNSFGIVLANSTGLLQTTAWQYWSRMQGSIDWSAANTNAIIGDYNGDGRADILLQTKRTGANSYWFAANASGQFVIGTATATLANVGSGTEYVLLSANFDGAGNGVGFYRQARTASGGPNGYADDVAGTPSNHDFSSVQGTAPFANKVTPGTAVGAIPGEFSVDPAGGASYRIPIALPPGVAGVQPELSLSYSNRGGNGLVGVGWTVTGLSAITRCPFTVDVDAVADGVDFDASDAYCLDGQRLKAIVGANGSIDAEYSTELESFQKVLSKGGDANNPAWWEVSDKAGLIRQYGAMGDGSEGLDSRIEARLPNQSAGPNLVWAVKRIRDRFGNFIEVNYADNLANSSFWPTEITYGSAVTSTKTVVGRVVFNYYASNRPDATSGYMAGGHVVGLDKLLQKITVYARQDPQLTGPSAATARVREYLLNYEQSPTSGFTQLASVVLCDGGGGAAQSCFEDTLFDWQNGYRGFGQTYSSLVRIDESKGLKFLDFNADGRTDYAYTYIPTPMLPTRNWATRASSLRTSEVETSHVAKDWDHAVTLDYDNDGYQDIVQRTGTPGNYEVVRGGANGLQAVLATTVPARGLSDRSEATAIGDFNADGRQDLAYVAEDASSIVSYEGTGVAVQLNTGTGLSATSLFSPAVGDDRPADRHTVTGRKLDDAVLRVVNFDGDGRDDVLMLVNDCAVNEVGDGQLQTNCLPEARVFSVNESGQLHQKWPVSGVSINWGALWDNLKLVDTNGDGLTDIMYSLGANLWVLNLGSATANSWTVPAWSKSSINVPYCVEDWTHFGSEPQPLYCPNAVSG